MGLGQHQRRRGWLSNWLHAHTEKLKSKNAPGGFGNHRKYESLNAKSKNGTGAAVESYVKWVGPPRTHAILMANVLATRGERSFQSLRHLVRLNGCAQTVRQDSPV